METRIAWGMAGLLAYAGAAITFAMGITPLFESGITRGISELSTVGFILVSAMLFGLGGLCLRRAAGVGPFETDVRETDGSEPSSGHGRGTVETPPGSVGCAQCGTVNEAFYTFCEGCAAKL